MLPNKKRVDSKHIVRMGPECYNSSRDNIIYGGYYISDMTYIQDGDRGNNIITRFLNESHLLNYNWKREKLILDLAW